MGEKKSANTQKRKPPRSAWKPGTSGNPRGAPRRGESWTEIIKRVGDMTPAEAAATSLELARQLLKLGDGLTLKEAVVLRVYGALLFDPNPGLLNAFMNRAEGMPNQNVSVYDWRKEAKEAGYDPDELVKQFADAMVARDLARGESGAPDGGE